MRQFLIPCCLCSLAFALIAPLSAFAEMYFIQDTDHAATTERFTNENWHTLPHPEVASFSVLADGSAEGMTVTGVPFIQFNVPNDAGIRVQRFEIQDHYHYIVEGEVVDTFEEFSAVLAVAYNKIAEV